MKQCIKGPWEGPCPRLPQCSGTGAGFFPLSPSPLSKPFSPAYTGGREENRGPLSAAERTGADMQLWQDAVVAGLAAFGLASLMWMAVRAVLFARPPRRQGALALLPARGNGEGLEEQVHTLQYIRGEYGGFGRILLVDRGLTEEGRKLCELLAGEDRWVSVCAPEAVETYLN